MLNYATICHLKDSLCKTFKLRFSMMAARFGTIRASLVFQRNKPRFPPVLAHVFIAPVGSAVTSCGHNLSPNKCLHYKQPANSFHLVPPPIAVTAQPLACSLVLSRSWIDIPPLSFRKRLVAWTRFLCPGFFTPIQTWTQKTCPGYTPILIHSGVLVHDNLKT